MTKSNLFERMKINNEEYISICGVHEAKHKSKKYQYLQTPGIVRTPHLIICCCLNIGIEPPGYKKPKVSSNIFGWINTKEHKKREIGYEITNQIGIQYQRYCTPTVTTEGLWDPTIEKVKKACIGARERFGKDRILFHYNGHGVPLPTINHECWFFDEEITTYVPMNISEIYSCIGERGVYVFDCPYSERLFKWFIKRNEIIKKQNKKGGEYIVFSGYGDLEAPQTNPKYPIDIFSTCLTTPLSMAILDYYYSSENIIKLPTSFLKTLPIEHKTKIQPFSELYAILTSIIETIAWNVLPAEIFMKLFRQDIAVASLFRHFILACRIMKKFNYKPQSFPEIPDTSNHLLWKTWDSVLELAIPKLINSTRQINYLPTPFFNNLIISLKTWLSIHPSKASKPCILPMIFRLFLRKDYTYEVFGLICEYVDLGFFACDRVVNIGFIPLLVQSLEKEGLEEFGIFCLAKIFSYDSSLISHYLKGSIGTLIKIIQKKENIKENICGLFLLSQIFKDKEIIKQIDIKKIYNIFIEISKKENWLIKIWSIVCLTHLIEEEETIKNKNYLNLENQKIIIKLSKDKCPLVRCSIIYLIIHIIPKIKIEEIQEILNELQNIIFELAKDGCPTVRSLLVVLIFKIILNGYNGNKYQEILEYLGNDPDPDVIRASEGLILLNEKIKEIKINNKKQIISPIEQIIKTNKKIFEELIERFYCSIRDIFRKPLLIEVINENKIAKKEWFEKQSIATQSSCRDLYIEIPNKEMKEENKLILLNNMYIPKKVIFHPTLPVILTDIGNDTIGIYEYKISQFPTKTFCNFNPINTSINFIDWINKNDSLLISGCEDGSIRIWGDWSNENKLISSWRGIPNQVITNTYFSTLSNNKICVGADYSLYLWDIELEKYINTFKTEETITCLSQFSDKSFFCGGINGIVNIIDIRNKNINHWKDQKNEIVNIGYSTRSFTVVTTSKGDLSQVCLYDIRKISENQNSKPYKIINIPEITCACVHEEAPYFAIGTSNKYVQLYNVITGTKYQDLKLYENIFRFKSYPVNSVCFPDYDFSLGVTTNTNIIIYSLN
ncbi:hypothetical protein, conserved [Entamoeba dispar SAW760]|uniref:Raptor N-terminal CASPase-like domain-containing protein n=1 Tax=Entamoeba dispar (strain ATCC PRA-260 / SAW760) TaxID=370354 RepID=B0EQY9_ENTDS|nr:uncharacterized protein EDI_143770 [Entamoeba dispar SAW760]EDR23065.1 hypothetical protein, conserved [Entamoeba dispar SAW760]|eukprot:EDR23065.1 hypothetical protein, conserved [Entamoeba dispar SAW760]